MPRKKWGGGGHMHKTDRLIKSNHWSKVLGLRCDHLIRGNKLQFQKPNQHSRFHNCHELFQKCDEAPLNRQPPWQAHLCRCEWEVSLVSSCLWMLSLQLACCWGRLELLGDAEEVLHCGWALQVYNFTPLSVLSFSFLFLPPCCTFLPWRIPSPPPAIS